MDPGGGMGRCGRRVARTEGSFWFEHGEKRQGWIITGKVFARRRRRQANRRAAKTEGGLQRGRHAGPVRVTILCCKGCARAALSQGGGSIWSSTDSIEKSSGSRREEKMTSTLLLWWVFSCAKQSDER